MKTKDLTNIAIFSALMAICAWISLPSTVPFTLQTFAVFLALNVLGGKKGLYAILVYIALGLIGVPVFAGFSGGVSALFGSTGGYIFGFILQGLLYIFVTKYIGNSKIHKILALILGLILCYAFGTAWFVLVYTREVASVGIMTALGWCVIPYIIPDLLKMALSFVVAEKIKIHTFKTIKPTDFN